MIMRVEIISIHSRALVYFLFSYSFVRLSDMTTVSEVSDMTSVSEVERPLNRGNSN